MTVTISLRDRSKRCTAGARAGLRRRVWAGLLLATLLLAPVGPRPARADTWSNLAADSRRALDALYRQNQAARMLRDKAHAVLVFPNMVKAGFMFGGQIGNGTLFKAGRTAGYYNSVAASYGFQAGAQTFGYALFFMNDAALAYLDKSEGFEIGAGPSLVVVDQGMAKSLTSTTLTQDVYAFIFDQKGLMGGVGLQGSKITRIK